MKLGEKVNIFVMGICYYDDWKRIGTGIWLGKEKVYISDGRRIYPKMYEVVKYKKGIVFNEGVKFLPIDVKKYSPEMPKKFRELEVRLARKTIC